MRFKVIDVKGYYFASYFKTKKEAFAYIEKIITDDRYTPTEADRDRFKVLPK